MARYLRELFGVSTLRLIIALVLILSLVQFWAHFEVNRCFMSYMGLKPKLLEQSVEVNGNEELGSYKLHKYCSGLCEPVASRHGFPILFLPGTRGSYKTIRSLASSQDYFVARPGELPFDYFTIDNNEDLTALSGETVERQSKFLRIVIDTILSMYRGTNNPPRSVLLVGHSLGVISIMNLLSDPSFDQRKVRTVFALAGPLLDPIFSPGPRMDLVYDRVWRYFSTLSTNSSLSSSSLVLLSLTGGSRDLLVPDVLGHIGLHFSGLKVLTLSTSAVSFVWASCDHLCILWCRQLVYALTSSLLDMKMTSPAVDFLRASTGLHLLEERLITRPLHLERQVISSLPTKSMLSQLNEFPQMVWLYKTGRDHFYYQDGLPSTGAFIKLGPFFNDPNQHVLIMAQHLQSPSIFLCRSNAGSDNSPCNQLYSVAQDSTYITWMPAFKSRYPHTTALFSLPDIQLTDGRIGDAIEYGYPKEGVYIVLAFPPFFSQEPFIKPQASIQVESFDSIDSRVDQVNDISYTWPLVSRAARYPIRRTYNQDDGGNTKFHSIFHRVIFPMDRFLFSQSLPAPRLTVVVENCTKQLDSASVGLVTWHIPWNNHFFNAFLSPLTTNVIDLEVPSPQPKKLLKNQSAFVDLYLNPYCTYTVSVHYSITQWIAKLIRLHWPHLFGVICAHLLLELIAILFTWSSIVCHLRTGTASIWKLITNLEDANKTIQQRIPTHLGLAPQKTHSQNSSFLLHLSASLVTLISFHLIDFPASDWIRMQKYGHLGLRYADSSHPYAPNLSSIDWFLAHCPLLLLTGPLSILMPWVLSLFLSVQSWSSLLLARLHLRLRSSGCVLQINRSLIIVTLLVGGLISEAVGLLLLAVFLRFRIHLKAVQILTLDSSSTVNVDSKSLVPIRNPNPLNRSLLLTFHGLLFTILIMLSLLLPENWVSLLLRMQRLARAGPLTFHHLLRVPSISSDLYLLFVFLILTYVVWRIAPNNDSDELHPVANQSSPVSRSFIVLLCFAGCFGCIFLLLHTAIFYFRIMLLCSSGLILLLFVDLSVPPFSLSASDKPKSS